MLINKNVVIIGDEMNPSSLGKAIIENHHKYFPDSEIIDNIIIPPKSNVILNNGYEFEIISNRIIIRNSNGNIDEIALKMFVDFYPQANISMVGLNCDYRHKDISLLNKFLNTGVLEEFNITELKFKNENFEEKTLNLKISIVEAENELNFNFNNHRNVEKKLIEYYEEIINFQRKDFEDCTNFINKIKELD